MKSAITLALTVVVVSAAVVPAAADDAIGIRVEVSSFRTKKGHLVCHLYDRAETFPSPTTFAKEVRADVKGASASCQFSELPRGEYAVAVFHDENDNGKLDVGLFGPSEPYGVSNNRTHTFSAPKWEECKFTANLSTLANVTLRH